MARYVAPEACFQQHVALCILKSSATVSVKYLWCTVRHAMNVNSPLFHIFEYICLVYDYNKSII